jgi:hypothetical protein
LVCRYTGIPSANIYPNFAGLELVTPPTERKRSRRQRIRRRRRRGRGGAEVGEEKKINNEMVPCTS